MSVRFAVDTSIAVPLLISAHGHHSAVADAVANRRLVLAGHAAVETYSVMTRLPVFERVLGVDALTLIDDWFEDTVVPNRTQREALKLFADLNVVGGATYDALVACAALDNDLTLVTRDERALPTYAGVGVTVELISS